MSSTASNRPQDERLGSVRPMPRIAGTVLWQQLRADLFDRIEKGTLAPGAALPSEGALAEAYKVNRLTVRRALADLTRAGIVRTEHGVGSFVASQPLRHRIDDGQVSLLESMALEGHEVRQLVLDVREVTAEAYAFPAFPGAVMEYHYIRWVDELPWSVSFAAVPEVLAPPTWDGTGSVFAAMSAAHGIEVHRDERSFSAVPADPQDAAWLETQVGAPLLLLKGTNVNAEGKTIAHIVHRIRGDRAEYATRVPR